MNPPVDAYGNPVTIGDLTSRPLPPAPPAAAAVFAAPAPGALDQDLREDILRVFGPNGEGILKIIASEHVVQMYVKGMYARYKIKGKYPHVTEQYFAQNLHDLIKTRDNKGGRKYKRKSMKRKSMKQKIMKRKSMKRKNMKQKNKMRF